MLVGYTVDVFEAVVEHSMNPLLIDPMIWKKSSQVNYSQTIYANHAKAYHYY